jgi:ubiquitin C-terminal hydrolase
MNATLQCLSQIEKLANYFKYSKRIDNVIIKNPYGLTKDFKYLIENLWPSLYGNYIDQEYVGSNSSNNYFKPKKFKKKISSMNPLFEGVQANDAKDLVNFIIMTLHEELNKAKKYQNNFVANFNVNQTNQNEVLNNFLDSFINENKSIISDIFYGITHTITNCLGCGTYKHNYEAFFFLNFPLEEIRKYKLQLLINQNLMISNQNQMNMNMNMNQNFNNQIFQQNLFKIQLLQNNQVNIFDCFEYNQKIEYFTGENAMYCNTCQMQKDSNYATYLYSPPLILILVLNRGQGTQFRVKMEFCAELNLTSFFEAKQNNQSIIYDLIGVVTHMGESGASGHFIATCKSPIDGLWYQYNDDLAYRVHDFNKEILNYAMPYILFYQKRN